MEIIGYVGLVLLLSVLCTPVVSEVIDDLQTRRWERRHFEREILRAAEVGAILLERDRERAA